MIKLEGRVYLARERERGSKITKAENTGTTKK